MELHNAIRRKQKDVALLLIEKSALTASLKSHSRREITPLDVQNNYGNTPLHSALRYKQKEVALLLIEKGVQLDVQNKFGITPLHYAILIKQKDVALLLIGNGASLHMQNNDGKTPLDYIADIQFRNMIEEHFNKINTVDQNKFSRLKRLDEAVLMISRWKVSQSWVERGIKV